MGKVWVNQGKRDAKSVIRPQTLSVPALLRYLPTQFRMAREDGFPSRTELQRHVESLEVIGQLKQAIAANNLARVDELLTANPELRQLLIDDVLLMSVAQPGRIPMMELLVHHGADVNALGWGWFPVLFTPCENLQPEPLQWLLDHGADPNRGNPKDPGTALDYSLCGIADHFVHRAHVEQWNTRVHLC